MAERKHFYNFEEPQQYLLMAEDEPRAIFVDTSLNTHLAVAASPFLTVSHLQQQISLEHFNCFPKFGRIIVKALSVEFNGTEYHLPETMLLKTAFHGSMKTWIVSAEIWKPVGYLDYRKDEVKHVKSSQDHHITKQTKPSPKHGHDHRHVSPPYHRHVSSHYHETPKTSSKKKKKDEKRKDVKKIDIDVHKQPTVICKPKENVKTKIDVSKTGSQDRKTVMQKDHPVYYGKEQLDDKTRNYSQRTGEDSGHKLPHRPCVVHHNTSVVQPSVLPMEDGGDNVVKDLQGTSVDFAENSSKKRGPRARKKKNKKSNINSSAVTSVDGCAILGKGDAPSDNGNTIHKNGQNGIEPAGDVSLSQLNNVREPLSQQDLLNLEKEIEEDLPLMNPHNTSKKRKACESERESRNGAQKVSPLHLSNVTELLAQGESLNSIEKEKEIKEDLKLENTAKKRKTNKAKSSNTNLEFSSGKPNDSGKTDVTRNIHGELSLPDDVGSLDENVETASITAKNFQSRKAVPDPSVTSVKERPDDEIKHMASTITAIQSDKPNKKSQKKQSDDVGSLDENVETVSITAKNSQSRKAVPGNDPSLCSVKERPDDEIKKTGSTITAIQSDKPNKKSQKKQSVLAENLLSITGNQHSNETMMEMDSPINVDDSLKRCDANDALVKSDDNDQEYRKSADVASSSLLNDAPKVMSQDEPLNMIENEKETKEDVGLLKSENTAKKRKTKKAKNSGMENRDSSSSRQNQEETDGTRLVHLEHSLQNDVGRPEGNVETINGNLKKFRNRKAVHEKDHCVSPMLEQPDEDVAISSIQGDKPKKRTRKKQSVPGIDLSSLPVDQQLDEKTIKMDAPKRVEQTESCHDDYKRQEKVVQGEGHHDKMSETLSLEGPSGLEDMRLLDKPRASKRKTKKLDPLTSVETSSNGHNLVKSKKKWGCEKTSAHQKPVSNHGDLGGVSHAVVEDGSNVSGANFTMEMDVPKRVDDSLTDNKSNDVQYQKAMRQGEELGEFSPATGPGPGPGPEVCAEVRQLEKPRASKQKTKKVDQPSSVDTLTNGHKLVDKGSPETFELQGSITDQKNNKSTPPPSAKHSTVSKNLMDTLASPADLINTLRKTGVSCASLDDRSQSSGESSKSAGNTVRKLRKGKKAKEPSDKLEENGAGLRRSSRSAMSKVLGASQQKKGGLSTPSAIFDDENSSSSDGEDRTNASNSSTTLPPEDSEEESKGVLISEHDSLKNNGSSKANSSGLKLESILRSSSRYKKAKLVASQSQGESEPPEFVPDSQADK